MQNRSREAADLEKCRDREYTGRGINYINNMQAVGTASRDMCVCVCV